MEARGLERGEGVKRRQGWRVVEVGCLPGIKNQQEEIKAKTGGERILVSRTWRRAKPEGGWAGGGPRFVRG